MERIPVPSPSGGELKMLFYSASSIADLINAKEQVVSDSRELYFQQNPREPRWMLPITEFLEELPWPENQIPRRYARFLGLKHGRTHGALVMIPVVRHIPDKDQPGSRFLTISDVTGGVQMDLPTNIECRILRKLGFNIYPNSVRGPWRSDILVGAGYTTAKRGSDRFTLLHLQNRYVADKETESIIQLVGRLAAVGKFIP